MYMHRDWDSYIKYGLHTVDPQKKFQALICADPLYADLNKLAKAKIKRKEVAKW